MALTPAFPALWNEPAFARRVTLWQWRLPFFLTHTRLWRAGPRTVNVTVAARESVNARVVPRFAGFTPAVWNLRGCAPNAVSVSGCAGPTAVVSVELAAVGSFWSPMSVAVLASAGLALFARTTIVALVCAPTARPPTW